MSNLINPGNRYIYVINQKNKQYDSLKEFMLDQGITDAEDVKNSKVFYSNLLNIDGTEFTRKQQSDVNHPWHNNKFFEYIWRNPDTKEDFVIRRMKRFKKNELI